jgi:hypothetical protein
MNTDAIDQVIRSGKDFSYRTEEDHQARAEKEAIRYTGFIAQEVADVAEQIGFDFSGVDAPKNEKDLFGLRYAEFVVPLVKAVQEQQQQIAQLTHQLNEVTRQLKSLTADANHR